MKTEIPHQVDLLVLGSGAAGMTAALTASLLGLEVLLIEKTDKIGGTSAVSAGSVWAPNSKHSPEGQDSHQNALTYLRNAVGNQFQSQKTEAFLQAAPNMVEMLESQTVVKFRPYLHHPDYLSTLEGATLSGRVLEPLPFDGSLLGKDFMSIRPPFPEFTLLGGMMVDRTDINHLLNIKRRFSSLSHSVKILVRHAFDRLRYHRGTRLVMGNALVGRLLLELRQQQVSILLSADVSSFKFENGRLNKAIVHHDGEQHEIATRKGIVLATGGLSHHPDLRANLMPPHLEKTSPVVESAQGDGFQLAETVGGSLTSWQRSNSFWAPVSFRARSDGTTAVFPHFVLDRGKPGILAVDSRGQRFVNEATTYHLFGEALFQAKQKTGGGSCFLICDDSFMDTYGLGMVRPGRHGLKSALNDGYIRQAQSLKELASVLGLPDTKLEATVSRFNQHAKSGKDLDFHKGEDAYQLNLGNPAHHPNPCLGELTNPPFYAVEIHPEDIGASAGLACDAKARVLDKQGEPIDGLFACGNDMASIMADKYPGPGITLGPAMTFGYIAARTAFEDIRSE
ncbi:FAD-dependent oxidoreductase [Alphaproteobacteria bacterium]|nr:FAD-dependent oxidoreductase [Alphaproteobacteria bacterium]